jgi:hypothetical protein
MEVYKIKQRMVCKPVLKLDFTAPGVLEFLSEFGLYRILGAQVKYGVRSP